MLTESQYLFKLGQKIEKLGAAKFKVQSDFSFACEVDTRTLRRIIKGEQNPSILILRKIAKGLEISLEELITV